MTICFDFRITQDCFVDPADAPRCQRYVAVLFQILDQFVESAGDIAQLPDVRRKIELRLSDFVSFLRYHWIYFITRELIFHID